mgnify:CR=1 FL=1
MIFPTYRNSPHLLQAELTMLIFKVHNLSFSYYILSLKNQISTEQSLRFNDYENP